MSGNDPDDRNPDCPGCGEETEWIKRGYGSWTAICPNEECEYHDPTVMEKYNEGTIDPR